MLVYQRVGDEQLHLILVVVSKIFFQKKRSLLGEMIRVESYFKILTNGLNPPPSHSNAHSIHVWYIYLYLHLVDFYGKCQQIHHDHDPMG